MRFESIRVFLNLILMVNIWEEMKQINNFTSYLPPIRYQFYQKGIGKNKDARKKFIFSGILCFREDSQDDKSSYSVIFTI
jgi:hypothetical protein